MKTQLSLIILISVSTAFAEERVKTFSKPTTKKEMMDRVVDEMAVSSRETAILNLKRMIRLKKGTEEEPLFIWRLADMEWRATKSHFRVGISRGDKSESNRRFEELLYGVIEHTTDLMTRFPRFKYFPETLVRRGKAYEELGKKDLALRDFLTFIGRYPNDPNVVEVRLYAADIYADQFKHDDILKILSPVDFSKPNNGLNAQVADKQALAYFKTNQYAEALRKAEWLLENDRKTGYNPDTIAMVALFYGSAFEKRIAGYGLEHALDYFRKLEKGVLLGKISHQFIIVMRTKEMQAEVIEWKELFLKRAINTYDTLITLVSTYDAVINWKQYNHFARVEKDFDLFFSKNPTYQARAQNEDYFKKFKKELIALSDKLYETLPKQNKGPSDYQIILNEYMLCLSTVIRIEDPKNELRARLRFRMGEFYAEMKAWDKAQIAFSDVYLGRGFSVVPAELKHEARMRALTARYDAFKERGIIPQDLKAQSLAMTAKKKPLELEVAEWIKWVDDVDKEFLLDAKEGKKKFLAQLKIVPKTEANPSPSASPTVDPMTQKLAKWVELQEMMDKLVFESNRLLYSYFEIETAHKRFLKYVDIRPDSKMTPATCALVVDTWIESQAWTELFQITKKYQKLTNVAVGEFKIKLEELERQAHYKLVRRLIDQKDFIKAIKMGEEHLKIYADSKHRVDIMAALGRSAKELKKDDLALSWFNKVLEADPKHDTAGVAYFMRAQDHEKKLHYKEAFEDYEKVMKLPLEKRGVQNSEIGNLKKKLFVLGFASDDSDVLKRLAESPDFCGKKEDGRYIEELKIECDRFAALRLLEKVDDDSRNGWELVELSQKAPAESRAAWVAAAFAKGHQIPHTVIKSQIDQFKKSFEQLDPMTQMEVLVSVQKTLPRLYEKKVEVIEKLDVIDRRLSGLQTSIEKRLKDLAGLEKLAVTIAGFAGPETKLVLLGRLSLAFQKVADELKQIPVPKEFKDEEADVFKQALANMIDPLSVKSAQIGQQSWEIAKQAHLKTPWIDAEMNELLAEFGDKAKFDWDMIDAILEELPDDAKDHPWTKAIRNKRARPIIFHYQIAQTPQADRIGLDADTRTLLQFATLLTLGFPADCALLAESKAATSKKDALRFSYLIRLHQAVQARSYENIHKLMGEWKSKGLSDDNDNEEKVIELSKFIDQKVTQKIADRIKKEAAEAKLAAEEKSKKLNDLKTKRKPAQKQEEE